MKDYEVIFARNLLHVLVRYRIVKNKNSAVCGGPPFKKSKYWKLLTAYIWYTLFCHYVHARFRYT